MPRNVVFAIDLEPDEYKSGPTDSWRGTHITLAQLSSWRRRLEEQSQAPVDFNWFFRFDPQIERNWGRRDWVFQACPDLLRAVERHADLTGIHVHTWRWDEGRTETVTGQFGTSKSTPGVLWLALRWLTPSPLSGLLT